MAAIRNGKKAEEKTEEANEGLELAKEALGE